MKRILMIIAPINFRDEEFFRPKEVFEKKGFQVTVASKETGRATGMLGGTANASKKLEQVNMDEYDAAVFVGGSGASVYFNDETALEIARKASASNKAVGAICIAPSILANAGILEGKNATCYPSEKRNLSAKGAVCNEKGVVADGNIVTADGPGSAEEFGNRIAELLE